MSGPSNDVPYMVLMNVTVHVTDDADRLVDVPVEFLRWIGIVFECGRGEAYNLTNARFTKVEVGTYNFRLEVPATDVHHQCDAVRLVVPLDFGYWVIMTFDEGHGHLVPA